MAPELMDGSATSDICVIGMDPLNEALGGIGAGNTITGRQVAAKQSIVALVGVASTAGAQNLFDRRHPEFGAAARRGVFERSLFVQARWMR